MEDSSTIPKKAEIVEAKMYWTLRRWVKVQVDKVVVVVVVRPDHKVWIAFSFPFASSLIWTYLQVGCLFP